MSGSLFDDDPAPSAAGDLARSTPLAERMRPRTLDEVVGQEEVLGPGRPLREAIERDLLQSIILWGPPGTGKTTLARIVAAMTRAHFVPFSAVLAGIKEIKDVMAAAQLRRQRTGTRTIVFVDEIHRFNKAQQDAFLPRVEAGDIVLIGATTENPSFEVNAALLSRSKVFVLQPLTATAIEQILRRTLVEPERGLQGPELVISDAAVTAIAQYANGDARSALNLLEFSAASAPMDPETCVRHLDLPQLEQSIQRRALLYDKGGEEHYNLISALHKSMRNSDPDAAVYWVARMLEAGEDPLYIARRLVRFASEDVGNADPQALTVAVAAKEAAHFIGMPEGNTALAQAAIYLATAPKSNAVYSAYNAAAADAHHQAAEPVPLHLRNAPTRLMKDLEYGQGLRVRPRRSRRRDRNGMPAAVTRRTPLLSANRAWLREGDHAAARRLAPYQGRAPGAVTGDLLLVGERINAHGSRRARRLLATADYDGLIVLAGEQLASGADALDVCVASSDNADEASVMAAVVERLSAAVSVPLLLDTMHAGVVQRALPFARGRGIVNSVHLEDGGRRLEQTMPAVLSHGAGVVGAVHRCRRAWP